MMQSIQVSFPGQRARQRTENKAENRVGLSCMVTQSCPTLCDPMDVAHQGPLSMGILQARILEWVVMPSSGGSSQLRGQTGVSHIAGGFFAICATRKPKNTGVGNLCLLQGIFLTQESNWGLPCCRWILYQLSYQGCLRVEQGWRKTNQHSYTSEQQLYWPWNSPGQNTGVGSLSLLQGIFPTQASNPGLPCCRKILYQLSHKGSSRTTDYDDRAQCVCDIYFKQVKSGIYFLSSL